MIYIEVGDVLTYGGEDYVVVSFCLRNFRDSLSYNGAAVNADGEVMCFNQETIHLWEPSECVIPSIKSQWRHKNGNVYVVDKIVGRRTTRPFEYPTMVIYFNKDNGEGYSRPLSQWYKSMTRVEQ